LPPWLEPLLLCWELAFDPELEAFEVDVDVVSEPPEPASSPHAAREDKSEPMPRTRRGRFMAAT